MPHITLETTCNLRNFDATAALRAINQAALDSGLFVEADIKSRVIVLDSFLVGISPVPRAFVHVRIALLGGRRSEERRALAEAVLGALIAFGGERLPAAASEPETQFSVETVEIDRASYVKAIHHA